MTLLTVGWLRWMIVILAAAGEIALWRQEWLRADRRNLGLRLTAVTLAIGVLALLGLRPARLPEHIQGELENQAILWTATASAENVDAANLRQVPAKQRFKLPDVSAKAASGATIIPDAAFLKRNHPELGVLHVLGDGLESYELAALHGWQIRFHPSEAQRSAPAICFLRQPVQLSLGQPFVLQGKLGGLNPAESYVLSLEGPDGNVVSQTLKTKDKDKGEAAFELTGGPAAAAGRFLWRLRLKSEGDHGLTWVDEQIGVAVEPPILPRILMLESAPSFETAHLQRWLSQLGSEWTARTLLGRDRFRFTSSNGAAKEFNGLDVSLLGNFDLVLTDTDALFALPEKERATLRDAIAEQSLGLLVLGTKRAGIKQTNPDAVATEFFLPWQVLPMETSAALAPNPTGEERMVRLIWQELPRPLESQIAAESSEIRLANAGQRALVRDDQGHVLAATSMRGRGQVALSLVRDTWRWRQAADSATFAGYWSFLLSQLAHHNADGHWSIIGGDTTPALVNQPIHLQFVGSANVSGPAKIIGEGAAETNLPLAQDERDSQRWQGTFWPSKEGWHRVMISPGGPSLDFFVHPAGSWVGLRADRVRSATQRAAVFSERHPPQPFISQPTPFGAGWLFLVFCGSAGYLWIERRITGA